jgi:gas vesicle protein
MMLNENEQPESHNRNFPGVLLSFLIGGLAGGIAMLLMAPQSGNETRKQIEKKGLELRDRSTALMNEARDQLRIGKDRIAVDGRQKAKELVQQGQALVIEQLDHVTEAAQAGKKAIQGSQA